VPAALDGLHDGEVIRLRANTPRAVLGLLLGKDDDDDLPTV
jgi:hypothetical protein